MRVGRRVQHLGDAVERLHEAFVEFANKVPFYGLVVACLEHPRVQSILPQIRKRYVTYGFAAQADYVLPASTQFEKAEADPAIR